jgi:tight adherence protein B
MLTFTAIVLISILILSIIVLRMDAKSRQVDHHLAAAMGPDIAPQLAPVVRLRQDRNGRLYYLLRTVLRYVPDAPSNWPTSYMILIGIVTALVTTGIAYLMFPLWLASIEGVVTACLFVRTLFGWQQHRYADKLMRQLPDTIELTVSAVRAGLPVAEAFRAVAREMPAPTREQFVTVVTEMALGRSVEQALLGVYQRSNVAEYAMFSVTLAVQMRSGGRLAETLQILGDAIRERVALAGRAKALASESRLASRVMASLPFLAGTALYFENPSSMDALFTDSRGQMMLGVAITMLSLGVLTMRRMIRKGTTV